MTRFRAILKAPLLEKAYLVELFLRRLWTQTFLRLAFKSIGYKTTIFKPAMLSGAQFVKIGNRTIIRYGLRLEVVEHGQTWKPTVEIGSNVNIEQNVHIICHDRIVIGDNVSITGHCAIVDVSHPHNAILDGRKIGNTIDETRSFVEIGEGSFIGYGAAIMPNVRIGRGCVIGANAVVTKDIPDFCVAAGIPARVIGTLQTEIRSE